jgi:hypothetical protein
MVALPTINQGALPAGSPGDSRDDLQLGAPVVVSDSGPGPTRKWTLADKPDGSLAVLSAASGASTQFTPDVEGTYRVKLEVNDGPDAEHIAYVGAGVQIPLPSWVTPAASAFLRIPAFGEQLEFNARSAPSAGANTRGWALEVNQFLRVLALNAFGIRVSDDGAGIPGEFRTVNFLNALITNAGGGVVDVYTGTVDSAAFGGNLTPADNTLQKVAEVLDGLVITGTVLESATIFVMKNGNNATGARGNRTKPYLTIAAAFAVAQSGDLVLVGPGTFVEVGLTIPNVARFHLRGSGIGVTTIQFSAGQLVRDTNSELTVLTLEHFTLDRGAERGVLIDGSAYAGGYFSSGDEAYLLVSYVEDISSAPFAWALGWSLVRCGNARFENCRFQENCGLVKVYRYANLDVSNCQFKGTDPGDYKAGLWVENTTSLGACVVEDTKFYGAWVGLLDHTQFSMSGCLALSSKIRISPEAGNGNSDGSISGNYPESTIEVYAAEVESNVILDGAHDVKVLDIDADSDGVVSVTIRNSSVTTTLITSDDTTTTPVEVIGCQACLPNVTVQGEGAESGGSFNVKLYNCTILKPTVTGPHSLLVYGGVVDIVAFAYSAGGTLRHYANDLLTSTLYPVV